MASPLSLIFWVRVETLQQYHLQELVKLWRIYYPCLRGLLLHSPNLRPHGRKEVFEP
jgi:hypothetical protein